MARVPLSKIELEEDEIIVEGFEAELEGIRVWVTAVLERTCVYETPELERRLVNKSKVLVERDQVPIRRRKVGGPEGAQPTKAAKEAGLKAHKGVERARGKGRGRPTAATVVRGPRPDAAETAE